MRHHPVSRVLTGTALVAGLLAATAGAAAADDDTHTVRPGETLTSIAAAHDAVGSWQELAEVNAQRIADPDLIVVGQELVVSGDATVTADAATTGATDTSGGDVPLATWERLATCESTNDWSIDTGNGYYGGLQFSLSSWEWVGGSGMPHHASKSEQIARAEILLDRQGWNAWPACSRALGLR